MEQSTFVFGPIQTQWLESLEQHPERQLKGTLGRKQLDGTYRACCLGELGLIAGVCVWNEHGQLLDNGKSAVLYASYEIVGLRTPRGEINEDRTGELALAYLNDEINTWTEIAKLVRENPEAYFNKSV